MGLKTESDSGGEESNALGDPTTPDPFFHVEVVSRSEFGSLDEMAAATKNRINMLMDKAWRLKHFATSSDEDGLQAYHLIFEYDFTLA